MNEALLALQTVDTGEGAASRIELAELSLPAATPGQQADGERLYELLQAEAPRITAVDPMPSGTGLKPPAGFTRTLEEAIVGKLDAIGAEYKKNVSLAYASLEKPAQETTIQQLLKMQLDIAVISLEVEVVGKGVQKATQHVDTLAKLQ